MEITPKKNNSLYVKRKSKEEKENRKSQGTTENIIQKKFICVGGYPDIKNALIQRGWIENTQYERYLNFDNQFRLRF